MTGQAAPSHEKPETAHSEVTTKLKASIGEDIDGGGADSDSWSAPARGQLEADPLEVKAAFKAESAARAGPGASRGGP